MKKIFSLFLVVFISISNLHSIVFVPVTSHQHYGEVVFIELHYKSDIVFIGSERNFAKNNLINAVTNTKYSSHYIYAYSNEPIYYKEVECKYKFSGCGHTFSDVRVEVLNEKVSDEDAYKWKRKYNKNWYQNYNWDTDEYEINGLFGLVCMIILILVAIAFGAIGIIWEEKHPEPSVEFNYNYGEGQYKRLETIDIDIDRKNSQEKGVK